MVLGDSGPHNDCHINVIQQQIFTAQRTLKWPSSMRPTPLRSGGPCWCACKPILTPLATVLCLSCCRLPCFAACAEDRCFYQTHNPC